MNRHLHVAVSEALMATSALFCALALSACGGSSADEAGTSSMSTLAIPAADTTASDTAASSATDVGADTGPIDAALAVRGSHHHSGLSTASTAATFVTSPTAAVATTSAPTTPTATTSVAATTATTVASATTTASSSTATGSKGSGASTGAATPASSGPLIGANIHLGGSNTSDNQKIADVMSVRHLGSARMDFNAGLDLTSFRDQVSRLKSAGIKAELSLQNSYQWDHACNQNFASVEQDSYNQTVTLVQRISDLVQDFELLNEVSLRPDTAAQVAPYQGTPASGYAGKSCYATMASVLRGMSRAIVDQRNASGAPLKIILGAVSNDFGFLSFMQQQGVTFDIVGYHAYPTQSAAALSTDPWFGPGGPIVQLAAFNKPVRVNEFNCGEIFASSYNNTSGSASNATCLAGIQKHLKSLLTQTTLTLQSVHAYELLDEPAKAAPENHFGLMVDLNTPKINLAAFALFAGGSVSSAEKTQLSTVGLSGL